MIIPPQFQDFAWYVATALIGAGWTIIGAAAVKGAKHYIEEVRQLKKNTDYLMAEDKLTKEMIAFYESPENTRRYGERRQGDRRRP